MIRAAAIFGKSTSEEGVAATVLGHVWYQEYPTQPARYCFVLFTPRVPKYWLNVADFPAVFFFGYETQTT